MRTDTGRAGSRWFEPGPDGERDWLRARLRAYAEHPERRAELADSIRDRFERTLAVLIIDSCGFTATVREVGIIHFLALFERLTALADDVVSDYQGRLLRIEADNIFAVFDHPVEAVAAARALLARLAATEFPHGETLAISIGVGFGPVLVLADDLFGDEMNLACKLGEDLAGPGEILLTASAYAALTPMTAAEPVAFEMGDCIVEGFRLTA